MDAGTCRLARACRGPPSRLLLGTSVCKAAPPTRRRSRRRPVWVNGDTVYPRWTPCLGWNGDSRMAGITAVRKTNTLVFAVFWAFPHLLPAQPSLRGPLSGERETRAGLPRGATDSPQAQGHQRAPARSQGPPSHPVGSPAVWRRDPQVPNCISALRPLLTDDRASPRLMEQNLDIRRWLSVTVLSGRVALPSRGLGEFRLLMDMALEGSRAVRRGGAHSKDGGRWMGAGSNLQLCADLSWTRRGCLTQERTFQ